MLYDPNWKPAETEIKLEPWQKILLAAVDILERDGWCQGASRNVFGQRCMGGAIFAVTGQHSIQSSPMLNWSTEWYKAWRKVEASVPNRRAILWNDAPGRTKEQVIAKLREVAHAV